MHDQTSSLDPRVVCLHGLGRTPADWYGVRPELARFGDVVAPRIPSAPLDCALASVAPSVLIVHARDDHHVPIDFAIAASRRHTDWSLEVLEHGGHHAHVTEPHLWAAAVTSWLDEHPDGAA